MGGVLKGVTNVATSALSGGLMGDNPISQALGIDGSQGDYYKPGATAQFDPTTLKELTSRNAVSNDDQTNNQFAQYGQGNASLADTLNMGSNRFSGAQLNQYQNDLATNPLTGTRLATDQVQSNPMLGQLFGKGGTLDQTNAEEQRLSNQGFQLTPEDREAYGQASGDISRMFGQAEQNAGQSLADRGLAAGPSGSAGALFSGLQGNKNEQLAQAQTNIANQRMQNTMQRLGQTRNFLSQLGQQGQSAIQGQYNDNLAGVQNGQNQRNTLLNANLSKYNSDIDNVRNMNAQSQASFGSMQANRGHTLPQAFGAGLFAGTAKLGQAAPGMLAGGPAGAAATGGSQVTGMGLMGG